MSNGSSSAKEIGQTEKGMLTGQIMLALVPCAVAEEGRKERLRKGGQENEQWFF